MLDISLSRSRLEYVTNSGETHMESKESLIGVIYTLVAVVLWSIIGLFVRQIPEIGPGLNVFYRFVFATAALFLYALSQGKLNTLRIKKRELPQLIIPGFLLSFTMYTYTIGLKTTTIANTVFLQQLAPIYVLVLTYLFLDERVTKHTASAVGIGICGGLVILAFDYGSAAIGGSHFYGDIIATISGFGWATYTISMRILGKRLDGLKSTFWVFLLGTVIMSPFSIESGTLTPFSMFMLLILGILCTALPFILYNIALRHLEAARASVIVLLEGVMSGIWAYIILNENVNLGTILGGALIIVATGIILMEKKNK